MDRNQTGWVGWIYFAGIMMMIIGIIHALVGFVSLFNNNYLIITPQNLLFVNLTTWAWAHLIMGIIVLWAGFAVFNGRVWARTIGVILASLSAIANAAFLPAYPIWSIIVITMDFLVIYALTVHGAELREPGHSHV